MQPALVSGEPQSNSTEESPISSREASGTRMGACLLRGGQYFLWIGLAALGIADHAVRPDQVDGALHEETARMIERCHFLPSIHQQRKRKVVFRLKLGVTSGARRIDSEHLRVALAGLDPLVAELAQLLPANRCVVAGVEYQDHVPRPIGRGTRTVASGKPVCRRRGRIPGPRSCRAFWRDSRFLHPAWADRKSVV